MFFNNFRKICIILLDLVALLYSSSSGRPRISYYDLIDRLSPDSSTNASVKELNLEGIHEGEDVANMRTSFDITPKESALRRNGRKHTKLETGLGRKVHLMDRLKANHPTNKLNKTVNNFLVNQGTLIPSLGKSNRHSKNITSKLVGDKTDSNELIVQRSVGTRYTLKNKAYTNDSEIPQSNSTSKHPTKNIITKGSTNIDKNLSDKPLNGDFPKISTRSEAIDEELFRNSSTVKLLMVEKMNKVENKLVTHIKDTTNMTSLVEKNNQNQKISSKKDTVVRRHLKNNHKKSTTHKQTILSTKTRDKTDKDKSKPQTHEITARLPSMYKESQRAYVDKNDSINSTNISKVKVPVTSITQQYENSTLTTLKGIIVENRQGVIKHKNSTEHVKSQETNGRKGFEEFYQILPSNGIENITERTELETFIGKTLVNKQNDDISLSIKNDTVKVKLVTAKPQQESPKPKGNENVSRNSSIPLINLSKNPSNKTKPNLSNNNVASPEPIVNQDSKILNTNNSRNGTAPEGAGRNTLVKTASTSPTIEETKDKPIKEQQSHNKRTDSKKKKVKNKFLGQQNNNNYEVKETILGANLTVQENNKSSINNNDTTLNGTFLEKSVADKNIKNVTLRAEYRIAQEDPVIIQTIKDIKVPKNIIINSSETNIQVKNNTSLQNNNPSSRSYDLLGQSLVELNRSNDSVHANKTGYSKIANKTNKYINVSANDTKFENDSTTKTENQSTTLVDGNSTESIIQQQNSSVPTIPRNDKIFHQQLSDDIKNKTEIIKLNINEPNSPTVKTILKSSQQNKKDTKKEKANSSGKSGEYLQKDIAATTAKIIEIGPRIFFNATLDKQNKNVTLMVGKEKERQQNISAITPKRINIFNNVSAEKNDKSIIIPKVEYRTTQYNPRHSKDIKNPAINETTLGDTNTEKLLNKTLSLNRLEAHAKNETIPDTENTKTSREKSIAHQQNADIAEIKINATTVKDPLTNSLNEFTSNSVKNELDTRIYFDISLNKSMSHPKRSNSSEINETTFGQVTNWQNKNNTERLKNDKDVNEIKKKGTISSKIDHLVNISDTHSFKNESDYPADLIVETSFPTNKQTIIDSRPKLATLRSNYPQFNYFSDARTNHDSTLNKEKGGQILADQFQTLADESSSNLYETSNIQTGLRNSPLIHSPSEIASQGSPNEEDYIDWIDLSDDPFLRQGELTPEQNSKAVPQLNSQQIDDSQMDSPYDEPFYPMPPYEPGGTYITQYFNSVPRSYPNVIRHPQRPLSDAGPPYRPENVVNRNYNPYEVFTNSRQLSPYPIIVPYYMDGNYDTHFQPRTYINSRNQKGSR